jgi:PST family polysaccharide transporter
MNIFETLIGRLKEKLTGSANTKAIAGNSLWLLGDRVLRMSVGIFINVWIARYLGPEQFGLWSYCLSFAGLFVVFSNLGLDTIVVRELVRHPEKEALILGTAFWMRVVAGLITFLITLLAIFFVRDGDVLTLWLVGLYSGGYIFQSLNVVDQYFQSKVQSKYTVVASNAAFIIATIAKVILLLNHASLLSIAAVGLGEVVFTALFFAVAYRVTQRDISLWQYQYQMAKELLSYSWPMILSGVSIMISLRIDQIMIGELLGDREVGIFAAAARMSELSFFIPTIIIASATTAIIQSKNLGNEIYLRRTQKLLDLTALLALGVAILMTLFSGLIINILFGAEYAEAAPLLAVHAWSGLFSCLGAASGVWMTSEGLQKNLFYRTVYGLIVNVLLNYWWIPIFGVMGAAMATICSQMMMSYLSDAFSSKTRIMFYMKTEALLLKNLITGSLKK